MIAINKSKNKQYFKSNIRQCASCKTENPEKGRAFDGRRAYRCKCCGKIWTEGLQGREKKYSEQRHGYQFANSKGKGHIS